MIEISRDDITKYRERWILLRWSDCYSGRRRWDAIYLAVEGIRTVNLIKDSPSLVIKEIANNQTYRTTDTSEHYIKLAQNYFLLEPGELTMALL